MRSKRLLQILVVFIMMFSTMGSSQPALASTNLNVPNEPIIINRNLSIWEASYIGYVSSSVIEKWRLDLIEPENFEISISVAVGDLVPTIILQDASGIELAQGSGSLTSSQPAGTYYIQVQPASGSGFYFLKLKQLVVSVPTVTTTASPASLNVGETALVTVSLSNVPAEGYTSAEFTCSYDETILEASSIVVGSLFGADSAAAISGPQNGTFIVAIAGSNGNKATTDGSVFTFNVKGLLAGQAAVDCTARVSKGDNVLTAIDWVGTSVNVTGTAPTATETPTAIPTFTSTPDGSPTVTSTPDGSPTFTSTPDGSATVTSTPDGSPTVTSTPDGSPTVTSTPDGSPTVTSTPDGSPTFTSTPDGSPTVAPTFTSTPGPSPTPLPDGNAAGRVIASKPVTVGLYDEEGLLVTSAAAAVDGTFQLTAPGGTYTVVAVANGCLNAEGSVTLSSGSTVTLADVTLLLGDIDANGVIDQFDAMTIGMSYNTSTPAAADLNNDGTINVLDLEILAQNYRETGPIAWE